MCRECARGCASSNRSGRRSCRHWGCSRRWLTLSVRGRRGGLRGRAQAEPQALQKELGDMGLKMGQRQKMITALLNHLPT